MSGVAALIAEAEQLGCRLERRRRDGRQLVWGNRLDLLPADLRARLRESRDELLALLERANADHVPPPQLTPDPPEGAPTDEAQERAVTGLMLASHAHTCATCGDWACYGFGPPGKAPAGWFCPLHRADGERLRQRQ